MYNGTFFFFSISSSIPNTFRIYVFAFFAFFHVFWRYSCHLKDTRGFTLSTSCKLSRYKRNDSWGQITRTHASHGLPPARILVPDFKNTFFLLSCCMRTNVESKGQGTSYFNSRLAIIFILLALEVVLMNLRIVKLFANIPKCPIIEFSTELMIIQLSKFEGCHYAVSASIVHNEVLTSAVTPRGTLKSPIGGVSEIRRIHRLKL